MNHSYPNASIPPTTHIAGLYTAHSRPLPYVTNTRSAPHNNIQQHTTTPTAPRTIAACIHPQTHAHLCKQQPIDPITHTHHRNTMSPRRPRPNMDLTGWTGGYIKYILVPPPRPTPTPPSTDNPSSQTFSTFIRAPRTGTPACHVVAKKKTARKDTNLNAENKYVKQNKSPHPLPRLNKMAIPRHYKKTGPHTLHLPHTYPRAHYHITAPKLPQTTLFNNSNQS